MHGQTVSVVGWLVVCVYDVCVHVYSDCRTATGSEGRTFVWMIVFHLYFHSESRGIGFESRKGNEKEERIFES
jgi:hypothetical protein